MGTAAQPAMSKAKRSRKHNSSPAIPVATDDVISVSYRIRKPVHDKLRVYCVVKNVSQNEFVTSAIEKLLELSIGPEFDRQIQSVLSPVGK